VLRARAFLEAHGGSPHAANAATNAGFLRDEPDQSDAPGMTMPETGLALLDKIAADKSACGGLDCVVAGGFIQQGCLGENALGALFDGLPIAPSTQELPDEDTIDPNDFLPLLTTTLTQVIAQTCDDIGPAG